MWGVGRRVLVAVPVLYALYMYMYTYMYMCAVHVCVHGGHVEAIQRAWGEGEGVGECLLNVYLNMTWEVPL